MASRLADLEEASRVAIARLAELDPILGALGELRGVVVGLLTTARRSELPAASPVPELPEAAPITLAPRSGASPVEAAEPSDAEGASPASGARVDDPTRPAAPARNNKKKRR